MPKLKGKPLGNQQQRLSKVTASLLIGGAVLVLVGLMWQWFYSRSLIPAEVEFGRGMPKVIPWKLTIMDIVDLDLEAARLIENKWGVSATRGNYLLNSAGLGEVGNLIIYGHNRRNILASLKQVNVGDKIELTDKSGQLWPYRVVKTVVVSPKDISWLQPTDIPVLTVYTCTGLLDSQRLIVRAIPVH